MTIMRMMVMITMVRMMSLVMVMVVQGTDWQRSGGLLASHCKDKMVRVFDPRTGGGPTQVNKLDSVWVGFFFENIARIASAVQVTLSLSDCQSTI